MLACRTGVRKGRLELRIIPRDRSLVVSQAEPSQELKICSETPAQVEGSLAGGWSRATSHSLTRLYSCPCPTPSCLPSVTRKWDEGRGHHQESPRVLTVTVFFQSI